MNFSDEPSSDSDGIEPLSESSDEETTEEAEDEMLLQPPPSSTAADGLQHGPYLKLSRGEETNNYLEELNVINERKFMCSVDLFLDLFQKRCLVQWDLRVVKQSKGFQYIPLLIAKIFELRIRDSSVVTRNVSLNKSDPRLLAPTIAAKPPPPSNDLLKRKSRFSLDSKKSTSVDMESGDSSQSIKESSGERHTEEESSTAPLPMDL